MDAVLVWNRIINEDSITCSCGQIVTRRTCRCEIVYRDDGTHVLYLTCQQGHSLLPQMRQDIPLKSRVPHSAERDDIPVEQPPVVAPWNQEPSSLCSNIALGLTIGIVIGTLYFSRKD